MRWVSRGDRASPLSSTQLAGGGHFRKHVLFQCCPILHPCAQSIAFRTQGRIPHQTNRLCNCRPMEFRKIRFFPRPFDPASQWHAPTRVRYASTLLSTHTNTVAHRHHAWRLPEIHPVRTHRCLQEPENHSFVNTICVNTICLT